MKVTQVDTIVGLGDLYCARTTSPLILIGENNIIMTFYRIAAIIICLLKKNMPISIIFLSDAPHRKRAMNTKKYIRIGVTNSKNTKPL